MTPEEQQNDMSMEDILSSIKNILADDSQEQSSAAETQATTLPEPQEENVALEDDVFNLSQEMIVEEAADIKTSQAELDEIGPDFDDSAKEESPLLSPDDTEIPDFSIEDSNPVGLVNPDNETETMVEPEEDFSFNIDEILKSASEIIDEDNGNSTIEDNASSAASEIADEDISLPDFSDIDVSSEPILDEEAETFSLPETETQPQEDPYVENMEEASQTSTFWEENANQENLSTQDTDAQAEIVATPFNEIPAAVEEEPQELPEVEYHEIDPEPQEIPEAEFSEIHEEQQEPDVKEETNINTHISEEKFETTEKEDAADVSADIINNFAKMFAEQTQEHQDKIIEEKQEVPVNVSAMGNGNKTIEQVVEGVIQGIVASSVSAEMTKNVDIVAYAQKEIQAQTKAWLEANLPAIVEAAVQKEIERVMAKVGK